MRCNVRFALLLFTACGGIKTLPDSTCKTKCGLELMGPIPAKTAAYSSADVEWSCENIQKMESIVVEEFATFDADVRLSNACQAFKLWTFSIRPVAAWYDVNNRFDVSGLTYCANGRFEVSNKPPDASSFGHELAHVAQDCQPLTDCVDTVSDENHKCWEASGMYKMLSHIKLRASNELRN